MLRSLASRAFRNMVVTSHVLNPVISAPPSTRIQISLSCMSEAIIVPHSVQTPNPTMPMRPSTTPMTLPTDQPLSVGCLGSSCMREDTCIGHSEYLRDFCLETDGHDMHALADGSHFRYHLGRKFDTALARDSRTRRLLHRVEHVLRHDDARQIGVQPGTALL